LARHADALFHPAFLDPRWTSALNPYEEAPPPPRKAQDAPTNPTRSRDFDIEHIRIALRVDPARKFIEGAATITLRSFRENLAALELDASELNVSRVTLGNGRRLEFESFTEKLVVNLDQPLRRGARARLRVEYSASPRRGLFFIAPDEFYPDKPWQVWSQGEAEDNRAWFPCIDSPNQRQTTETVITVPEKFLVLSNGALLSEKHDERRAARTFHWRQGEAHPAYLVSIVVGEYEVIETRAGRTPVQYYTYPGTAAEARRLFGKTPQMIRHFSRLFGCEYPYPKYSQVLVDDFTFGAMENTSATTCTDRCLHDARVELDFNYHDIVAHELAHQWWGDLVTPKSWKHVWLKEIFATYAEALWMEHVAGRDESDFLQVQDFNVYLAEDRERYRRPIVDARYEFPFELYDRHAYQKGGLVLRMLRHVLGDEDFFLVLKHFLHKHAWQSVETNDLKVAIEEVTGQNLDWFFDQWLYAGGYPEFEVSHVYDAAHKILRLRIKQVQKTDDGTPLFRLPVELEVVCKEGTRTFRVQVEGAEHDFQFACETRPLYVLFDARENILKTARHEKSREELLAQLRRAVQFTARMRAARDLCSVRDAETIRALRDALLRDRSGPVRMAAAVGLAGAGGAEALAALIAGLKRNEEARVRRAIVWSLGSFRGEQAAIRALTDSIRHDESYYVSAFAMRALAHAAREDAYETLLGQLGRDSYQDVLRATVFDALAIAKDRRGVSLAIEHTKYGEPPSVRVAAALALGQLGKEHAGERETAYTKLSELLSDRAFRVRLAAVRALGQLEDPRAIGPLKALDEREAVHILKSAARASVRKLEEQSEEGKG
jgi:aminopeptidase N